jgi:nucleotide-binding universal stress UspA family protein
MPTILVGTDLTEQSLPAIVRGVELARASGARLIVCHAADRVLPVNPLFPHETGANIAAATDIEQLVVDAVTQQVIDATDFTTFDVVVDIGEPSDVICAQAHKFGADLVIVTADRPGVGAVARDLSTSPCSVLVLGSSTGTAAAIVTLESEVQWVAQLAEAVRGVVVHPVSKFLGILWADSAERKAPLLGELDRLGQEFGVPVVPWFADLGEPSALARVARDPEIGIVALAVPEPDRIVERRASPLDDGFEGATASFLIVRR